ncbi:hypothetical protein NLJ89_g9216 [Agrocybe chaxingu]|uniref:Argonaute-like protein n=1 Tax=Agrocybe chaxingu TaxID=84603 RepID=A0A9W8K105_9AGAR|nr:hypothetical protein NLJ89_g9216 [Agrocybe chaxingu]
MCVKPQRPGFGTGGRTISVIVNAFATSVPDGMIYHYDGQFPHFLKTFTFQILTISDRPMIRSGYYTREAPSEGEHAALQPAPPECSLSPILGLRRPQECILNEPTRSGSQQLRTSSVHNFDVTLAQEGPATARPPKVYKMKVTQVAEINAEVLHRFIAGQQSQDNIVLTSIMALNVAIRMGPNNKYPFNTRSFFTDRGKQRIGAGIELWRGYFQSLRPSQNQMYINIDIATGLMYREGPLLDLCLEFLNQRDPSNLSPVRRFPDRERLRLQRFISNMRVMTTYGGKKKAYVVKKVSVQAASEIRFTTRDGRSVTVADYFRSALNVPLRFPDVVCVEVGSGAMLPLEVCMVPPGQIMRKQIPADKTNDVLNFSKQSPSERLKSIREGLQVLDYGQSEYVRHFGMNISSTPMTVTARILRPPTLRYGPGSKEATIEPRFGAWNMIQKKCYKPSVISSWVVVIFEGQGRFNQNVAREMVTGFIEGARSVGMTVNHTEPPIFWENGSGNISGILRRAGGACKEKTGKPPTLIVVVLPEGGNQIYSAVKYFGDVEMGVATQCLKSAKCYRAKPQYWANVMLKVNVKLGGINAVLKDSPLNNPNEPVAVMGADVIHPAPGAEGRPSFASLVSSVDVDCAKYVAYSGAQTGRQELISDLEEMVKKALVTNESYRRGVEKNTKPLHRLIFYRDGVSEGQFEQVLQQGACLSLKMNPKITLIIVGKRHHIRMFPQTPNDGDKSGNCQAGTTIDNGLGHPTEFDYYQLSHGGLLGTSRPAHYSVIYDDSKFPADAMQNLSFALAHVYARATRSVSIPAPVYYADIVCSRAKNHYAPGTDLDLSDTATVASSRAEDQLQRYREGFRPLHANMSKLMYFM